jgi:hypothetical protein
MIIDRKFKFVAVNPVNGHVYTEENGIVFAAKDKALPGALRAYRNNCANLGCEEIHLTSLDLLIDRVEHFQLTVESRRPDTNLPGEIERCIYGRNLSPKAD